MSNLAEKTTEEMRKEGNVSSFLMRTNPQLRLEFPNFNFKYSTEPRKELSGTSSRDSKIVSSEEFFHGLKEGMYYNAEITEYTGEDAFGNRGANVTALQDPLNKGDERYRIHAAIESRRLKELEPYIEIQLGLNIKEEKK